MSDLVHLSDEQAERAASVRRLARETLAPIAARGAAGRVNRPLVRALAEHGLVGGGTAMDLCLVREALASECTEAETAFALQGLGAQPLRLAGRAGEWLERVDRGEAVAAFALTEPEAGTDVSAMSLAAERDGDGYRLTGEKAWISNAPDADFYALFARAEEGITGFLVPGDADGLRGEPLSLLAPHPIGRLELDGVRVPAGHVLGEPGGGMRLAMRTLDRFRPSVGAFAVGMAQAALETAIDHAGRRESFGQPLREHQAVSQKLAEMATRTQAARLLVHQAALGHDRGLRVTRQAAMAKLFATEAAQWVVDAAVQIHGAAALEEGHLLEHLYRDVRAPRIYEGTSEIQREIIARELYRERG